MLQTAAHGVILNKKKKKKKKNNIIFINNVWYGVNDNEF